MLVERLGKATTLESEAVFSSKAYRKVNSQTCHIAVAQLRKKLKALKKTLNQMACVIDGNVAVSVKLEKLLLLLQQSEFGNTSAKE